jgi:peptidoglycan/xylan/chitin deacetylase (PgdA/CDA1 family)
MKQIEPMQQIKPTKPIEPIEPMKQVSKPLASISLDLDNQWVYLKAHGDPDWAQFPSYLNVFIPEVLDILDELGLRITFFIVGQDAALPANQAVLAELTKRGHEVGNHSFDHDPMFHLRPVEKIRDDVLRSEEAIHLATGAKTVGFRGPGFVWTSDLIKVLVSRNYQYDASSLPTFIGPVARAYYFRKSNLTREERRDRSKLYGSFKDVARPLKAYSMETDDCGKLLEVPVTTIPIIRTPFHLSYLIYLSKFSETLMRGYLNLAIQLCKMTKTSPSFLLHPLDLLGGDRITNLRFFPGMDLPSGRKRELFRQVITTLSYHFRFVGLAEFVRSVSRKEGLRTVKVV